MGTLRWRGPSLVCYSKCMLKYFLIKGIWGETLWCRQENPFCRINLPLGSGCDLAGKASTLRFPVPSPLRVFICKMKGRTRSAFPDLWSGTSGSLWEPLKLHLKSGMHVGICCFFLFLFLFSWKGIHGCHQFFKGDHDPEWLLKLPRYLPILLVRALWPEPEQSSEVRHSLGG